MWDGYQVETMLLLYIKKSVQVNCYACCNSNRFEKHVQDIYNIYGNTVLINV